MPPRKPIAKPPTAPAHAPYAPLFMVVIVALLTIALLLVWRELPTGSKPMPAAPIGDVKPVPAASTSTEQVACEAARGKWVECGNPCHGKPGDVCITSCEPQCLCGGIAGWMCPTNLTCTDYEPEAGVPDALGVCRAKPAVVREAPAGMICDDTAKYCFSKTLENSVLGNPYYVTGSVGTGAQSFDWKLLDGNGKVLGGENTQGVGADESGEFHITGIFRNMPDTTTGTLRVSPGLDIPIRFAKDRMKVTFFSRAVLGDSCTELDASVYEIPKSSKPITAALGVLLWEATENPGLVGPPSTQIPQGTKLNSAVLSNGTLKLEFSKELENYGGGSCNVESIRTQIEKTAMQFGNVSKVEISVPGKTAAETLQP